MKSLTGSLVLLWGLGWMAGLCGVQAAFGSPLVLTGQTSPGPLWSHLELLEDATGTLGLAEVQSGRFTPNQEHTPNFGFTQKTLWAKVSLQSRSAEETHWLLEYAYPLIDHLELFVVGPQTP